MLSFLKNNRLRISVVSILMFFLFYLAIQADSKRSENWFSYTVQYIAYPFQTTHHFIKKKIKEVWFHYIWLVDVREENERLWNKLWALEEENAEGRETKIAHQRLRELLQFKNKDRNIKVFAEVIVEIEKPFYKLLIINKGSNDGIRPNFAVVTPEGIVGKIQSVTAVQSVVQLIKDSRSQFPVLIQRTRTKAILYGSLEGTLTIKRIPRRLALFSDDLVVTSGLAGIFPKGFPVGRIKSVNRGSFGLFQSVELTSSVDLRKVEEVIVILKNVNNIHQPLFTEIEQ
ncbi:rod shape-determining protein MreC [bacterium]|nr:rod shape-determining protein MreC [bacterium]